MNIYLDVDGTLFHKKTGKSANHLKEFLEYVLKNHQVFWLTTHCRGGANRSVEHITQQNNIANNLITLLNKIKPTDWRLRKTEAIDFTQDFVWLDDCAFEDEKRVLRENNALHNLIVIDLRLHPNQLLDIMNII